MRASVFSMCIHVNKRPPCTIMSKLQCSKQQPAAMVLRHNPLPSIHSKPCCKAAAPVVYFHQCVSSARSLCCLAPASTSHRAPPALSVLQFMISCNIPLLQQDGSNLYMTLHRHKVDDRTEVRDGHQPAPTEAYCNRIMLQRLCQ
jgi:hypothetical protein